MIRHRSVALLLAAAALASCEKNAVQDISGPAPGASVRFFNFGIDAPGVNFYADDRKMTAITSTDTVESTLGTAYGAAGNGGFYAGITPGRHTFSGRIAAATDKNLAIASLPGTLEDGKYYSVYLSGFYDATAKTVDAFIVEDPFVARTDYAVAYVRFVHAMSNANPMTLYAKNATTGVEVAVGGEVSYKGAGGFVALPGAVYQLNTRYSGSATNAITQTGVSFLAGRVYTVSARGDIAVTSTTDPKRPILDNSANR